ncbi:MAG: hypothetical protein M3O55_02280 [Actinomycetota bacterium]|nr:hypothetical protein [Actinomycetota bacterium]
MRDKIERRSIVALTYLNTLPRPVTFGLVMLVLLAGVLTTGILAAVALGIVTLFLAWLLYVGWPQMSPSGRLLRLLATLLVAGFAVRQLLI